MSNILGQFDHSDPEDVVSAKEGSLFFRDGDKYFLSEDGGMTELRFPKKAFNRAYRIYPWYLTLKEEIITFKYPSEVWKKTGKGNNKKGWTFISGFELSPLQIAALPTPTPTLTATPGLTPTPTPTVTSTPTPSSTSTPTPTPTQTSTETPAPSSTSTPVPTETPAPSSTSTPVPTDTPTPTPTLTATTTDTPTPTPTLTATPTPSSTPTQTPTPTTTPDMTVSVSGATQYVWSTGGTGSFTHTPSSQPNGALVFITNVINDFNRVSTVKYGNVSMAFVTSSADASGEKMNTQAWFLGSGLPSGAQTVSVTYTGAGSDTLVVHVATFSNPLNSDTQVQSYGGISADTANPQITLATNGKNSMTFGQLGSGFDATSSLTPLSGMTTINDYDAGAKVVRFDRQTTSGTSNFTFGYTGTIEDAAFVTVNVSSV